MRRIVIPLLLAVFILGAAQKPALAGPGSMAPVGVVLQATHATVSAGAALSGASVFDGDALMTDNGGSLQVRFGGSQAYLMPHSSAVVHESGVNGFGATLMGGTVILSSAKNETFQLIADGATIRPATSAATVGQVTMISPTELVLTSQKGAIEASLDGEVKTLQEGNSVRMVIQPADPAGSGGPQTRRAGRNHFLWIALALVGVGVGIALWQALVSPDKP